MAEKKEVPCLVSGSYRKKISWYFLTLHLFLKYLNYKFDSWLATIRVNDVIFGTYKFFLYNDIIRKSADVCKILSPNRDRIMKGLREASDKRYLFTIIFFSSIHLVFNLHIFLFLFSTGLCLG